MPESGVIFNNFGLIYEESAALLKEAVKETATAIELDVKGQGPHAAPIDTGNLRRSYHVDFEGTNAVQVQAHIGNDMNVAEYAGYVEYGTSRMSAQPHLTPASEAQRDAHDVRVAGALAAAARAKGL